MEIYLLSSGFVTSEHSFSQQPTVVISVIFIKSYKHVPVRFVLVICTFLNDLNMDEMT